MRGGPSDDDTPKSYRRPDYGTRMTDEWLAHVTSPPMYASGIGKLAIVSGLSLALTPLHRVQVLMATQQDLIQRSRIKKPFSGMWNCLRRTVARDGWRSMWRTLPSTSVHAALSVGLSSAASKNAADPYLSLIPAAAFFPLACGGVHLAADLKPGKIAIEEPAHRFRGTLHVWRHLVRSHGLLGLWRGSSPLVAALPVAYGTTRLALQYAPTYALPYAVPGVLAVTAFPFIVVSTRMTMQMDGPAKLSEPGGMWSTVAHMVRQEGVRSLFRGAVPYGVRTGILIGVFGFLQTRWLAWMRSLLDPQFTGTFSTSVLPAEFVFMEKAKAGFVAVDVSHLKNPRRRQAFVRRRNAVLEEADRRYAMHGETVLVDTGMWIARTQAETVRWANASDHDMVSLEDEWREEEEKWSEGKNAG